MEQKDKDIFEHTTKFNTGIRLYMFQTGTIKTKVKSKVIIPDSQIIDYKEALIFAYLGLLRSKEKVNCLKSVTGAIKDHCSGKIFKK